MNVNHVYAVARWAKCAPSTCTERARCGEVHTEYISVLLTLKIMVFNSMGLQCKSSG